jgi:hypothetical protein
MVLNDKRPIDEMGHKVTSSISYRLDKVPNTEKCCSEVYAGNNPRERLKWEKKESMLYGFCLALGSLP